MLLTPDVRGSLEMNREHCMFCRGIFITGSSLLGAAIRVPRITSKNLIR